MMMPIRLYRSENSNGNCESSVMGSMDSSYIKFLWTSLHQQRVF